MPHEALNPDRIHVLSWNIAKGRHRDWQGDLQHLTRDADLALIQEATLEHAMHQVIPDSCWAFAPGFTSPQHTTGVLTIARARTLQHSAHRHWEPLTRLPKAALVTEYRLQQRSDTLLVANVHAINFTAGTGYFRHQLASITQQLAAHRGPLILCGDFNTWRPKRVQILQELIDQLDLRGIDFALDHRRQAFGFALDHIFVRGLRHKGGTVRRVYSSDHNPLSVILGV
jgi:endonuclease/exonuclease/phosphatase (EEP) superfamily protein YafD